MKSRLTLSLAATTAVAVGVTGCGRQCTLEDRPNVIFIYADDLGKGMLSAYGQRHFTTPNIDAIIGEGVSFSRAYGCWYSGPARASLLTGYHDCRSDKWSLSRSASEFLTLDTTNLASVERSLDEVDVSLPDNDLYLAEVFREAGYVTGQVGKLEYGFNSTRKQMERDGWDHYYGFLSHIRCHGYFPPFLFRDGEIEMIEGNTHPDCSKEQERDTPEKYADRWNMEGKVHYSQDLFLGWMIDFIRENKDRPFFLYHPTQLPHGPVSVPAVHPELVDNEDLLPMEREYASMVKMLDDHVGVLVAELERLGLMEKTIIIFGADNGHELYYSQTGRADKPYRNATTGERFDEYENKYYSDLANDVFNGNASMAGLKRNNLQGGINVPLAFYWRGRWDSSRVSDQLIANYDMLTTFADLLGVELATQKDGISYLPILESEQARHPEGRYVVASSRYGVAVIRNDGWKLRSYEMGDISTFELFNLNEDPKERCDLRLEYPEIVAELQKIKAKECEDIRISLSFSR
ncbi:MAG: sulfatase-like hydrolase/transferase [Rikenellaceae bacterium]